LYTKSDFNNMQKFPEPSIRTSNIWGECLRLLSLPSIETTEKLSEVLSNFIEPPHSKYIKYAIIKLIQLGLINDDKVTGLGKLIADTQMDPSQGMAIWASYNFNCSKEVIALLAMIDAMKGNLGELFTLPIDLVADDTNQLDYLNSKFLKVKKELSHKYGDFLTLLKIYSKYLKIKNDTNKINQFTYKYFLKRDILSKTSEYFKKIRYRTNRLFRDLEKKVAIPDLMEYKLEYRIIASLLCGFPANLAYYHEHDSKRNLTKGGSYDTNKVKGIQISKISWLNFLDNKKKEIFYYELFKIGRRAELIICSPIPQKSQKLFDLFQA
jgi:HrpA-like RNA helicase